MTDSDDRQNCDGLAELALAVGLEGWYEQLRPIFFMQTGRPLTRKEFLQTTIAVLVPPITYMGLIKHGLPFAPIQAQQPQVPARPRGIEIAHG